MVLFPEVHRSVSISCDVYMWLLLSRYAAVSEITLHCCCRFRTTQAIFEHLKQPQYKEKIVTCTYLEIYNEDLRDLLLDEGCKSEKKLEIMEGKDGTFCR